MYRVVISHGEAEIEYPFENKKEALDMYVKQCAHYAEICAILGDRCAVSVQNVEGAIVNKTEIKSKITPT